MRGALVPMRRRRHGRCVRARAMTAPGFAEEAPSRISVGRGRRDSSWSERRLSRSQAIGHAHGTANKLEQQRRYAHKPQAAVSPQA